MCNSDAGAAAVLESQREQVLNTVLTYCRYGILYSHTVSCRYGVLWRRTTRWQTKSLRC
jgi:hypothetical protein